MAGSAKRQGARNGSPSPAQTRPVDLNSATAEELTSLPMVGPRRAEMLIARRPFRSWEDVSRLPGFSQGMIDEIRRGGGQIVATAPTGKEPRRGGERRHLGTLFAFAVPLLAAGVLAWRRRLAVKAVP